MRSLIKGVQIETTQSYKILVERPTWYHIQVIQQMVTIILAD